MKIKKETEEKIRKLLVLCKTGLQIAKIECQKRNSDLSSRLYPDIVESLRLRDEIAKDLGYIEDKQEGKLKQGKLWKD